MLVLRLPHQIVNQYRPVRAYVETLQDEIALVADAIARHPRVDQVHWGGGTPTMLSEDDFWALMTRLRSRFTFSPTPEVAVEIDPRTLTEEKAIALAEIGVTRASLGVQDFNPEVQTAINREQPFEVTERAVDWLRGAGIEGISFDLMYGLPCQTTETVVETVDLAQKLAPDRIALFGYAHVPWMKKHQRLIDDATLPGIEARYRQAEAAADRLADYGYQRIGLDHFAKADDAMSLALAEGRLKRNFQGYTTDQAGTLLGFGASAIGCLRQGYVQNAVPFAAYAEAINAGDLAVAKGIELTPQDIMRRDVIERLMCDLHVDLGDVAGRYNAASSDFREEVAALQGMARDGIVELSKDQIDITETGRPLVRTVCAVFDAYLGQGTARHSRAV